MSVSKIWVILYKLLLFVLLIILDPFAQYLLQGLSSVSWSVTSRVNAQKKRSVSVNKN